MVRSSVWLARALAVALVAMALGCSLWMSRTPPRVPVASSGNPSTCAYCHVTQVRAWAASNHAHAGRAVDPLLDVPAVLAAAVTGTSGRGALATMGDATAVARQSMELVVGREPIRQYATATPDGRYHVSTLAFHEASATWFDVMGGPPAPTTVGESVWNGQCAPCHTTGLRLGYAPRLDTYATTWQHHGVTCAACHAPHPEPPPSRAAPHPEPVHGGWPPAPNSSAASSSVCLPCHTRREPLTADAHLPGASLHDHFALELPDQPQRYHADGQVSDEVFEGGSLLLSRMGGHAGVGCADCHDPHSGQLRAPVANNELCLGCHATGLRGAVVIADSPAHSHHAAGSAGNLCVNCHMPVTLFMQRDPRHDHGFTTPDPLMTREQGIPNACSRCHANRDNLWAESAANRWYGASLQTRQRQRARAIASAQAGDATAHLALVELAQTETVPAWRAALTAMLAPWATVPAVTAWLTASLTDSDPMVRAAAVRALAEHPRRVALLGPRLTDPVRVVRLTAGLALRDEWRQAAIVAPPTLAAEMGVWLDQTADTVDGALRRADWALVQGDVATMRLSLGHALHLAPNDDAVRHEAATLMRLASPR